MFFDLAQTFQVPKMMKLLILSALVAVACAGTTVNPGWRIIGGSAATAGQFPYIVSLRRPSSHSCGGSIINEFWILTAAHCTEGASASSIKIVAGSHLLSTGGTSYNVAINIWHPEYNSNLISNDVALLKLTSPIQFGTNVQAVPLATSNIGGSEDVKLCGWGTTVTGGSTPNNLQWIDLKTVTVSACQSAHGSNPVYDSQVCTLTKSGEGACHGDSGGPLTDSSGNQVGIVSWGMPCARGYPDVFTRVFSFNAWIASTIAAN